MRRRAIVEENRTLLDQVRAAVLEVEPSARIILDGSRARGDAEPDSDWDLLVLVDGPVDHRRADAVSRRLYALSLEQDDCPVLCAIVHSREEWDSPLYRALPFHANVEWEGVEL